MRFFSNDKTGDRDDDITTARDEAVTEYGRPGDDPERVTSDPVAVPQQRSGSPWSDAPAPATDPAAPTDDPAATSGGAAHTPAAYPADAVPDGGLGADPGPGGSVVTGSAVVGSSAAAGARPAGLDDEVPHGVQSGRSADTPGTETAPTGGADRSHDEVDLPLDDTDAGREPVSTTTYSPDGTVTTTSGTDADPHAGAPAVPGDGDSDRSTEGGTDGSRSGDPSGNGFVDGQRVLRDDGDFDAPTAVDPVTDKPLDRSGDSSTDAQPILKDDGGFDAPTAVDPVTDNPLDRSGDSSTDNGQAVLKDDGGFDAPTAVDPVTDKPLDRSGDASTDDGQPVLKDDGDFDAPTAVDPATDKPLDGEPAVAAVAVPGGDSDRSAPAGAAGASGDKKPGSVPETKLETIFAAADAQSFQERWRDVQLRFVDSPRDATDEASGLVDEAVDKLTAALRTQKESVSTDRSTDTEQLRVELRAYRDMLNRILGL